MNTAQLKRVVVIGTSCSGKTTLAHNLARKLQVPHIELDAMFWKPNWRQASKEEFRNSVANSVASEEWVTDGNYSVVRDILWPRATTIIWLDYSFHIVARRALTRTFRNVFYRKTLWSGNRETLRQSFLSRDSILWWIIKTYRRRRREYPRRFKEPAHRHLQIIVLASPAEAERFLDNLN